MYFLRRYFLLNNKPVNFLFAKSLITTAHCLCIPAYAFNITQVQFMHPSVMHQSAERVQGSVFSALDLPSKRQTENLGVPMWLLWTPDLHLSLSHENLSHGARGSLHLCLCLEVLAAPEVQILPILIRWCS